jgi:hypothetical protein
MALRGDYLVLQIEQYSSGTAPGVLAETTSVSIDFSAEALETTNQSSGLAASFIGGKVTGTASGEFLVATSAANFDALYAKMAAGTTIDFEFFHDGGTTAYMTGDCIVTALSMSGGNSDQLATGSYSLQLSGTIATA